MKTVYVTFYNNIYVKEINLLMESLNGLISQHMPDQIYLLISSQCGAVESGFTAFNFINALKSKVEIVTHNIGTVESIANLIFLAGDTRLCSPGTSFAFHGVSWTFGQQGIVRSQISETLQLIEILEKRLIDVIVDRTSISKELAAGWMSSASRQVDADDAQKFGIVGNVVPADIPKDAIHYVVPFTYIGQ